MSIFDRHLFSYTFIFNYIYFYTVDLQMSQKAVAVTSFKAILSTQFCLLLLKWSQDF